MAKSDDKVEITPAGRILISAVMVGGFSLAAGLIAAALFSDGNLAPLFGSFVTGPVGLLVGAALGIVWSVIRTEYRVGRTELIWYFLVFFFALLGNYWWINSYKIAAVAATVLAIFTILIGSILLAKRTLRQKLPIKVQMYGTIALIAASLMVIMAIIPPVTEPWWVPQDERYPYGIDEAMPQYAFFLDSRLDGSVSYPQFAVNKSMLLVQWFLVGVVATIACLLVTQRQKK